MTEFLNLRVSPIDLARLKRLEEATGLTKSEIVRRLLALAVEDDRQLDLIEAFPTSIDRANLQKLAEELHAAASSLESAT